jgi:hypothetical protein
MIHMNLSVVLVVVLLGTVVFVLLRRYGAFWGSNIRGLDMDSLEIVGSRVSDAVKGKSRKGIIQ